MVESGWLDVHYQASRVQYENMLHAAGFKPGWKVLDAGAGSGSYLPLLSQLVGEHGAIHALDLADENVKAIEERLGNTAFNCSIEVSSGSVLALPFEDKTFDGIWCANTVQYFKAAQLCDILSEFKRVLKPGGLLAVKEFDDVGLHFGPFDTVLKWHLLEALQDSDHLLGAGALFTPALRSHLLAAGFSDVRMKTFTGDFQPPLRPIEQEFLGSALELYYSLAEKAKLPAHELSEWRRLLGSPQGEHYILSRPDFYFREVHGLATGISS